MKIPFVDLHSQYLDIKEEIDRAIKNVINESAFIRSSYVDDFEEEFSKHLGVKRVVSCANGTDSLYILMRGLGLRNGDEVITTAHSWISTSETITQAGGKVVFCDTEDSTYTINTNLIESKITKNTVGIIPVHLYGQPADMDSIMAIARKYNLWVIEDCAQAHMAEYKGRKVGTIGNAGSFSFYPGKNLGAMGDAGCIVTNDDNLANWCEQFARHGGKGIHTIEGINSRMDGIQAAVLSVKLPHLENWTNARIRIANSYNDKLSEIKDLTIPFVADDRNHVYHLYVVKVDHREELNDFLRLNGVSTMINYSQALPFYPAYNYLNHSHSDFPIAYENSKRILSIPIYPELTDSSVDYVSSLIKDFFLNKA
jgi:dTDP-4-amino-4,6-dideoxygalactose transaminase